MRLADSALLMLVLTLLIVLLLGACATAPPPLPAEPAARRCLDLYAAFDRAVAEHGITPSHPRPVADFPYLRVDRFLADYSRQPLNQTGREAWLARLAALDREARAVELASLPDELHFDPAALDACSRQLQAGDLRDPARLETMRKRASVPDDYHSLNRFLGLYPLSALPVRYGVFRWHEESRRQFALPLKQLPLRGSLRRFRPPEEIENTVPPAPMPRDALGVPTPDPAQTNALFAAYAPVFEIDVAGQFDKPGAPLFRADGTPSVNPDKPLVYRYVSYTRWAQTALLQLNYVVWFSERPRKNALDILGGALDGLIWRVTLDQDGRALVYDSIHPCGCYHMLFPTARLKLRLEALKLPEPPLVPQAAPAPGPGERIVIRLNSGNHYIVRVYAEEPTGDAYAWRDYRDLYSVPAAGTGDKRSLFGPDGLAPGSERRERWLLWPMGVPSPGAMRERGRHATAFIGRRHFDDPHLLEKLFAPVQSASSKG